MNNEGDVIGNVGNNGVFYAHDNLSGNPIIIPTLGGDWSYATAINDNGDIVGNSVTSTGDI